MPVSSLTIAAQDYLKVIWAASEWSADSITVKQLAERTGVSTATVSDGIRKLAGLGMLVHEPYGSIELTDRGRVVAVDMVRRHRLVETFLVEMLDYAWDEVHDEAEVLEHAVSDKLIDRIDRMLGFPDRDPHGDPIPSAAGLSFRPDAVRLSDAPPGHPFVVSRISDADPALLRYVAEKGVLLDVRLTVLEQRTAAGEVAVRLHGRAAGAGLGTEVGLSAGAGAGAGADADADSGSGSKSGAGAGAGVGVGVDARLGSGAADATAAAKRDADGVRVELGQRASDAVWVTRVDA